MIKMIAAVSQNGILGKDNTIPWMGKYPDDMKFFRKMTAGATVVMGRNTFESMGSKPLPKRRNIVITKNKIEHIETYNSLQNALTHASIQELDESSPPPKDIWLMGGFSIYEEGMKYANEIYLTLIPEMVKGNDLVRFPWINPNKFKMVEFVPLNNEGLKVAVYIRT
jgi:dihydrofolate reductase